MRDTYLRVVRWGLVVNALMMHSPGEFGLAGLAPDAHDARTLRRLAM